MIPGIVAGRMLRGAVPLYAIPDATSTISVYQFDATARTMTRVASIADSDFGSWTIFCAEFSPSGEFIACGASNYVNGKTLVLLSFDGTALEKIEVTQPFNSSTSAGTVSRIAWSPDGEQLACCHSGTPSVTVYSVTDGVFTRLPQLSGAPNNLVKQAAYSPDSARLALPWYTSPNLDLFSRVGDTYTKLGTGIVSPGDGQVVAWNSDGSKLAVAQDDSSPYIQIYDVAESGLLTLNQSISYVASSIDCLIWSEDDDYLIFSNSTGPSIYGYRFSSGGFITGTAAISTIWSLDLIPGTQQFIASFTDQPCMALYSFGPSGIAQETLTIDVAVGSGGIKNGSLFYP